MYSLEQNSHKFNIENYLAGAKLSHFIQIYDFKGYQIWKFNIQQDNPNLMMKMK
jgi:predicted ABC-type ATPase